MDPPHGPRAVNSNAKTPKQNAPGAPNDRVSPDSSHPIDPCSDSLQQRGPPPNKPNRNTPQYDELELSVTEDQYKAIFHPPTMNQIFRIRAGPGSGKTFTLVARVAQLIQDGIRPDEILVLSMANRSVDSLKETLAKMVGDKAAGVEISTFHSFCAGLLEQYGSVLNAGYTKQRIFDEATWKTMIDFFSGKQVKFGTHTIGGAITPARLNKAISSIMSGTTSVEAVAAEYKINVDYVSSVVHHLKSSGLIRYDELISEATRLMRHSAIRMGKRPARESRFFLPRLANYKAVFVDEFQDVYPSLSSVVRSIAEYPTPGFEGQNKHLTITGDPNQSIYDFLGTREQDMLAFHENMPDMEVVDHHLLESFRCTQPILDAAVEVALKDPDLHLQATRSEAFPQKPVLMQARSTLEEFHLVADEIVRLLCQSGGLVHLDDIAILAKTNDIAIGMQSVLKTRYGLPSYKLSSGNQWVTSRLHILKQILGVIAGDSSSSVSLMSILRTLDTEPGCRKRVSALFSESINRATKGDTTFLETYLYDELSRAHDPKSVLAGLYKKYPAVLERMAGFLNQVQTERQMVAEVHAQDPLQYNPTALIGCLQRMAGLDGVSQYLKQEKNETSKATPSELLASFNDSVHHAWARFSARPELPAMTFLDFFLQSYDSEVATRNGNSIKVSTIHAAKGLEFPVVFVLGQTAYSAAWDKILQTAYGVAASGQNAEERGAEGEQEWKDQDSDQDLQERPGRSPPLQETQDSPELAGPNNAASAPNSTARLLYVALTRARNLVYVGCRKPFREMSPNTRRVFSRAVPDLQPRHQSRTGPEKGPGRSIAGTEPPQPYAEGGSKRQSGGSDGSAISAAPRPATELAPASILRSISRDVKRPIPTRQRLLTGCDLFTSIVRKQQRETPVFSQKRAFSANVSATHWPALLAVPRGVGGSLYMSFGFLKMALRRRAA